MRMAEDDNAESGRRGIEIERRKIVKYISGDRVERHHGARRKHHRPRFVVDISAHRLYRSDAAEGIEDVRRSDVSGMDNQVDASQSVDGLGPQKTVSIRDYADAHAVVF